MDNTARQLYIDKCFENLKEVAPGYVRFRYNVGEFTLVLIDPNDSNSHFNMSRGFFTIAYLKFRGSQFSSLVAEFSSDGKLAAFEPVNEEMAHTNINFLRQAGVEIKQQEIIPMPFAGIGEAVQAWIDEQKLLLGKIAELYSQAL